MSETPAYLIARLNVKNYQEYLQRYAAPTGATLEQYGGEPIVACPTPDVAEGQWDSNWTVVLRFPDMATAKQWYESSEYQPLKELRINELTQEGGAAVFVDGFDPAAFAALGR